MWRNREFLKLWSGQAISWTGSAITTVAMPLVAVVTLHASAVEMGVLAALNVLPHLVFGLPAGLWASRFSLRRVLIVADLGRALLLGAIPLLASIGHLQMLHLYLVAVGAGTLTLLSDTASQSLLPVLIPRKDLMSANSATLFTQTVAGTAGPSLAGALIAAASAPFAITFDALSYAASAVTSVLLKKPPPLPTSRGPALSLTGGLRHLFGDPLLRPLVISATAAAAFGALQAPLAVLYLVRELHWSPVLVGAAITVAGVASALGALAAPAYGRLLGLGRAYITGQLLASLSGLALAAALTPLAFLSQLLTGLGMPLYGVPQRTLRQSLVPPALLPQTTATWRTLVTGGQTLGALTSGVLATTVGLRPTFILTTLGMLTATLYSALSALRHAR
ncbi:MFS transporter [Kribbella koreensis]|uniref:MFS transporter n=1 Tax=Kribbella koreensis TaxID=57909 RepID=A0ABN1QKP4_9ACTN